MRTFLNKISVICWISLALTFFITPVDAMFYPPNQKLTKYKIHSESNPQWRLSVAMVFQQDAAYLKEWVEFHRLVGVEHFYLYNNLSTDNYLEVLEPYIVSGEVELIEWPFKANSQPEWDAIQVRALQDAHKRSIGKSKWLAIIDSDEFLVPVQKDDLRTLLAQYENDIHIGGIYAYWVVFGTSYIQKVPDDKLMIETLVMNGGAGKGHFKTIIQPERTAAIVSPHFAAYKPGYHHHEVLFDELQINHYWSRDEWYLHNIKIPRREIWGTPKETSIFWGNIQNNDTKEGMVILRFVDQLRTLMGL